jgi:hypothetical protein
MNNKQLTIAALAVMISMSAIPGTTFADYSDHDRVVAQAEIRSNFDPPVCPSVVIALGTPDGSIQALCDDGETFRIGKWGGPGLDRKVTMRCSALEGLSDIKGCTQWGGDTLTNREYVAKIQLACGKLRLPLSECIAKLKDLARTDNLSANDRAFVNFYCWGKEEGCVQKSRAGATARA